MDKIIYYQIQTDILPLIRLLDISTVKPPYVHFRRKPDEYILYYILQGEMHLQEGDNQYALKPNDFIIFDPTREHYGLKPTVCTYAYIHFSHYNIKEISAKTDVLKEYLISSRISSLKSHEYDSNQADSMSTPDLILPKYFHINYSTACANLNDALYKMKESYHGTLEHHNLETSCMFMEFLISLSRELASGFLFHDISTVHRSTRVIHDMLSFFYSSYNQKISMKFLEEKYSFNFNYMNRTFRKVTGKTIFAYLNDLRITKAKQFLASGTYNSSEVAELTGFRDPYYFSKVFKKYAGITPSAYLKQIFSC